MGSVEPGIFVAAACGDWLIVFIAGHFNAVGTTTWPMPARKKKRPGYPGRFSFSDVYGAQAACWMPESFQAAPRSRTKVQYSLTS